MRTASKQCRAHDTKRFTATRRLTLSQRRHPKPLRYEQTTTIGRIRYRLMVYSVVEGGTNEYRLIYLSGLPRPTTATDLQALCVPFGPVVDVYIERDPYTGAQWGFGFVEFFASEAAERAARQLHGKRYRGDVLTARQVSGALNKR